MQFFRKIDITIRIKEDGNNNEKTLIALVTVFLLSGCVGMTEKDVKLQFLNNNAEVVKERELPATYAYA